MIEYRLQEQPTSMLGYVAVVVLLSCCCCCCCCSSSSSSFYVKCAWPWDKPLTNTSWVEHIMQIDQWFWMDVFWNLSVKLRYCLSSNSETTCRWIKCANCMTLMLLLSEYAHSLRVLYVLLFKDTLTQISVKTWRKNNETAKNTKKVC